VPLVPFKRIIAFRGTHHAHNVGKLLLCRLGVANHEILNGLRAAILQLIDPFLP
jgi:hypothetical protein